MRKLRIERVILISSEKTIALVLSSLSWIVKIVIILNMKVRTSIIKT
jgi:hypothetical protein